MKAYLGLGSNLGDRVGHLEAAFMHLTSTPGIHILRKSTVIETKAWGLEDQPDFLNMVLEIDTVMEPEKLLEQCLKIEEKIGRVRDIKWGPRIIDIDILLYEDQVISKENLEIPHKFMHQRRFVLESLNQLIPEYEHPILKKRIKHIFEEIL